MMSSRLLPSLLCNDVQSVILDMAYAVNIVYTVSLVIYTLYGNFYELNTANTSLIFFFSLTSYTFTLHLIIGQVFYTTDP